MDNLQIMMNGLRKYFLTGVAAVQPHTLMTKYLTREGEKLYINGKFYPLKNTYIVGFGKAVGGMVPVVANVLKTSNGSLLKEGILSVPVGYMKFAESKNIMLNSIPQVRFYEGAKDNLPDDASRNSAQKIMNLVKSIKEDDLLFVLVSGGGSALLPLPSFPLTLDEKIEIVKNLSLRGASIAELNTVRKAFSAVKGGKLAKNAKCEVVSFILSDIISSPSDLIAGGPTVYHYDSVDRSYEILRKYSIELTSNMKTALENRRSEKSIPQNLNHVYNILIGDNNTALQSIHDSIKYDDDIECTPVILTSSLQGEAADVGRNLALFAFVILHYLQNENINLNIESFLEKLCISEVNFFSILKTIIKCRKSVCLLFGGETTVTVKGTGKGGRNQEMVLACSIELERLSKLYSVDGDIAFLSGGTDGIDGPTDAAGALTYFSRNDGIIRLQTDEAKEQNLDPEAFLQDNNSFEYFTKLSSGKHLLNTGHTGTNVMDVQMLFISRDS